MSLDDEPTRGQRHLIQILDKLNFALTVLLAGTISASVFALISAV